MNKLLCLCVGTTLALFSCSTSSEEYEKAAVNLCNCMEESSYEEVTASDVYVNMGVCLLGSTVDLNDPRMVESIEQKCPEMKQIFVTFIERMDSK